MKIHFFRQSTVIYCAVAIRVTIESLRQLLYSNYKQYQIRRLLKPSKFGNDVDQFMTKNTIDIRPDKYCLIRPDFSKTSRYFHELLFSL